MRTYLSETFNLDLPIILAPMFLVSNPKMIIAAGKAGITGCIPAMNFRTIEDLKKGLREIKEGSPKPFGVNLIVNQSNVYMEKQLSTCLDEGVDYFITSLGGPKKVIAAAKTKGVKVFCDVTDVDYAQKVEELGADGIIAVNSGAGGHAGKIPTSILLPMLKKHCSLPVISAGGVGTGDGLLATLALGAGGVSIGSPFIATYESPVSAEYKKACLEYGAQNIVMTNKISGTPCSVIETPFVKKIGTEQNFLEKFLNSNKKIKKYAKMLTYYKGMKLVEKAAMSATYKTVWCAGPSIEFVEKEESVAAIVERLKKEFNEAKLELKRKIEAGELA